MTEQVAQEIDSGARCVRCHEPFLVGEGKVTGGGIHPETGQPQTRAIHAPPTCTPASEPPPP